MAVRSIAGGDKLARHLAELARKVTKPATLRVGFLEGATYPDGTSVPMVAAIQEFGAPSRGIPPRPFFRTMVSAKAESWGGAVATQLERTGYDAEAALKLAGAGIKGQLQQSIRDLTAPPLAPATVAAKGFSKPLIDTGVMMNAVDYEVES